MVTKAQITASPALILLAGTPAMLFLLLLLQINAVMHNNPK